MKLRKPDEPEAVVDMTPMIDCVFQLLIFFMVCATMSKVDQTPEVSLPIAPKAALQEDLRRASIEPYAWVLNKSVLAAGTRDPLLAARLAGERKQLERMAIGLAKRIFTLAWLTVPPIGFVELSKLVAKPSSAEAIHA